MKKLFLILMLFFLFFVLNVSADRSLSTIKGFSTSQLVKRGDARVYHIDFIPTSNNGEFGLSDELTSAGLSLPTTIKTEGKQATSGNSLHYDFSNKPLEFSTGLFLFVTNGNVIIEYE